MTNKIIEKGVVLLKRRSLIATSAKLKHGSLAIKACFASPMYTIVKFELWHESTVFIISNMLQWNQRIWIVFHTSFHSTRMAVVTVTVVQVLFVCVCWRVNEESYTIYIVYDANIRVKIYIFITMNYEHVCASVRYMFTFSTNSKNVIHIRKSTLMPIHRRLQNI